MWSRRTVSQSPSRYGSPGGLTGICLPRIGELTLSLDAARKINVSCSASWTRWRCCRRSVLSTGSLGQCHAHSDRYSDHPVGHYVPVLRRALVDELFDIPLAIYVMRNNELAAFLRDQGDPETSQLVLLRTLEELSRRLGIQSFLNV